MGQASYGQASRDDPQMVVLCCLRIRYAIREYSVRLAPQPCHKLALLDMKRRREH